MASEQDILARLPEAPAPSPDARQAAIASAVERFEKKIARTPKDRARPASHAADGPCSASRAVPPCRVHASLPPASSS